MDTNVQPSSSRKRPRESETESQKLKREKAAERQRRKRERDRRNAGMGIMAFSSAEENQQQAALQQQQHQQQEQQHLQQPQAQPQPQYQELTPEEKVRRERVRAAARERQRKHRQLVKQRRMRDLGLEMGNEMMMEEVHYRTPPDGQYPGMPDQQLPPPHPPLEAPFPHGAPMGGQTFASTLLLSFSCAPLLKQHLLRTLNMSNEELASLEPIIADAWDRWDHSRRMHYAEQVAKNGGQPPIPPPYPVDLTQHESHPALPPPAFPHPNGPGPADPNQAAAANDFRARFHRSIIGPTPFRTPFTENQTASTTTPSSASGSTQAEPTIDPHLATNASSSAANGTGTKTETVSVST